MAGTSATRRSMRLADTSTDTLESLTIAGTSASTRGRMTMARTDVSIPTSTTMAGYSAIPLGRPRMAGYPAIPLGRPRMAGTCFSPLGRSTTAETCASTLGRLSMAGTSDATLGSLSMAGTSAATLGSYAVKTEHRRPATLELAPEKYIGGNRPCFIIAEIGQNHQGDIKIAKQLVDTAVECGADCVKFQKSDLKSRFTKDVLNRPYKSRNSFGKTYGEHRMHLELTQENFAELKLYCDDLGIYFTASGMDIPSLDFLNSLGVPFFKIGSADALNLPLLKHVARFQKPIIISTGMTKKRDIQKVYREVHSQNQSIVLLQCTSCYPTEADDVNLNVIKSYTEMFPEAVIGYSGHEKGIEISIAAVASGAKVLERHLTLDHSLKGSDHIASLNPVEFHHLVKSIRRIEVAMGSNEKEFLDCEKPCHDKLGKTIVATRFLKSGTVLSEDMVTIKVASSKGFTLLNLEKIIGRQLMRDVEEDDVISPNYVDFWSWPNRRSPPSPPPRSTFGDW